MTADVRVHTNTGWQTTPVIKMSGVWAVHRVVMPLPPGRAEDLTITHTPTGRALFCFKEEYASEAWDLFRELAAECPDWGAGWTPETIPKNVRRPGPFERWLDL